jgi:hypothetical protein
MPRCSSVATFIVCVPVALLCASFLPGAAEGPKLAVAVDSQAPKGEGHMHLTVGASVRSTPVLQAAGNRSAHRRRRTAKRRNTLRAKATRMIMVRAARQDWSQDDNSTQVQRDSIGEQLSPLLRLKAVRSFIDDVENLEVRLASKDAGPLEFNTQHHHKQQAPSNTIRKTGGLFHSGSRSPEPGLVQTRRYSGRMQQGCVGGCF